MSDTQLISPDGQLLATRTDLVHMEMCLRDIGDPDSCTYLRSTTGAGTVYYGTRLVVTAPARVHQHRISRLAEGGYIAEENYTVHPSVEEAPDQRVTVVPFRLTDKGRRLARRLREL